MGNSQAEGEWTDFRPMRGRTGAPHTHIHTKAKGGGVGERGSGNRDRSHKHEDKPGAVKIYNSRKIICIIVNIYFNDFIV